MAEFLKAVSDNAPELVLMFMMLVGLAAMLAGQRAGIINWAAMVHDDTGKPSAMRFMVLVSGASSTWTLIYLTMNAIKVKGDLDDLFKWYALHLAVWSGAKVVEKMVDIVAAKFGIMPARAEWTAEQRQANAAKAVEPVKP